MGQRGRCTIGNCLRRAEVRLPHGDVVCARCAAGYFREVMRAFRQARGQRRRRENRERTRRERWAKSRATRVRTARSRQASREHAHRWAERETQIAQAMVCWQQNTSLCPPIRKPLAYCTEPKGHKGPHSYEKE